jgi:hypothetical protein
VLLPGAITSTSFLHAIDAANDLLGETDLPRAINEYGYPLEGMKTRFTVIDGTPYLFLASFRDKPVNVTVAGPYSSGRDLIGANDVAFPLSVAPLEPMLIRLDIPEPTEIKTAAASKLEETPAIASNTPTGEVEPIVPATSESKGRRRHHTGE